MKRGSLFQFAVMYHPDTTASEVLQGLQAGEMEQKPSKLIVEPKFIVVVDEQEVRILAAREIPAEYTNKIEQLEILVRPFCR